MMIILIYDLTCCANVCFFVALCSSIMAAHDASDNNLGFSVDSQLDDNVPLILDSR